MLSESLRDRDGARGYSIQRRNESNFIVESRYAARYAGGTVRSEIDSPDRVNLSRTMLLSIGICAISESWSPWSVCCQRLAEPTVLATMHRCCRFGAVKAAR